MKTNTNLLNLVTQILAADEANNAEESARLRVLAVTDLTSRGYRAMPAECKIADTLDFFSIATGDTQ